MCSCFYQLRQIKIHGDWATEYQELRQFSVRIGHDERTNVGKVNEICYPFESRVLPSSSRQIKPSYP